MDWDFAIDKHRAALKRVLAALASMAGLAGFASPLVGEDGSARRGEAETLAVPGEGVTLPRHLHRAVLRLLRPAEAAARRLVIVAARGLMAQPLLSSPPWGEGMGGASEAERGSATRPKVRRDAPRSLCLPLLDPLRRDRRKSLRASRTAMPRICVPGWSAPASIPPPPAPDDEIDATRLALRFSALARALDDLPRAARRLARWRARNAAAANTMHRVPGRRRSPLRSGRPPGQRPPTSRRPRHEIHQILEDVHGLAFDVLKKPDTS